MIDRRTRLRIFDWTGFIAAVGTGIGIMLFGLPPVLLVIVGFVGIYVVGAIVDSFDYQDGAGARWLRARRQAR